MTGDTTSVSIADTNWHHIALVFTRATNTVQFYVDGTLLSTSTSAPYSATWNLRKVTRGAHSISVRALASRARRSARASVCSGAAR